VQYHVGLNFSSDPKDLFIIDESDVHQFGNPAAFKMAIMSNKCVCLTGSPDNNDIDGLERRVLDTFNF
jgi:hypothetical protein